MTILETFWLKCRLGSLVNLAKHPSSTVQILGAEKALFRALKTKHDTPKYGLIYHASLVGQSNAKNKGKVSGFKIRSRPSCPILYLPFATPTFSFFNYEAWINSFGFKSYV